MGSRSAEDAPQDAPDNAPPTLPSASGAKGTRRVPLTVRVAPGQGGGVRPGRLVLGLAAG